MNLNTLTEISNEMYRRTNIPISIFNRQGESMFPYSEVLTLEDDNFKFLFLANEKSVHVINDNKILIASFLLKLEKDEYFIIIGPCTVLGSISTSEIKLSDYISKETEESFLSYLKSIFILFTHKNLDQSDIDIMEINNSEDGTVSKKFFEDILHNRRTIMSTKDSYELELRFIDYVEQGKKDKIDWILRKFSEFFNENDELKLSDDRLEDIKLKFTALITLMTRTSIKNGVPLDLAFSLSDSLIYALKTVKTPDNCLNFIKFSSFEFIELIEKHKTLEYSSCISKCIHYIDTHIYERINLTEVAESLGRSPSYLSSRFKTEVGQTFKSFIINKKIEEAKRLLLFTDHDYQQVGLLLNFTNQSHFISCFKKSTGYTPKSYKTKHTRYM